MWCWGKQARYKREYISYVLFTKNANQVKVFYVVWSQDSGYFGVVPFQKEAWGASEDVCVSAQWLSHVQLFVTPWTVAHQAPLFMGSPKQEYWSRVPFSPPGDLPKPGIEPYLLHRQVGSLPLSHQGSPYNKIPSY